MKARELLLTLKEKQNIILKNKKEEGFYIEPVNNEELLIWRRGKVIAITSLDEAEKIISHHNAKNWEIVIKEEY